MTSESDLDRRLRLMSGYVAGRDVDDAVRGALLVACVLRGRGALSAAERMIDRAEQALGRDEIRLVPLDGRT